MMNDGCRLRTALSRCAGRLAVLLALMALMQVGVACTQPTSAPIPGATPSPAPTATPAVASPAATPADLGCLPGETAELVWPTLQETNPSQVTPGGTIRVIASGGYVRCGRSGYIEGNRVFQLYLDDDPAGEITCYANRCEGELTAPNTTLVGEHTISVEGGSSISVLVIK